MVVIALPCAATASVRQDSTRRPSTCTVQAPHWPWSQPFLLPVSSSCSRRASSRTLRTSTAMRMFPAIHLERDVHDVVSNAGAFLPRSTASGCLHSQSAPPKYSPTVTSLSATRPTVAPGPAVCYSAENLSGMQPVCLKQPARIGDTLRPIAARAIQSRVRSLPNRVEDVASRRPRQAGEPTC